MYTTARAAIYDILDTTFVNIVITQYTDMPGTTAPREFVYSTSVMSVGENDPAVWAVRALNALCDTLTP
jgi:hypothetical protein